MSNVYKRRHGVPLRVDSKRNAEKVARWAELLKKRNIGVPESTRKPGQINWAIVSDDCGLSFNKAGPVGLLIMKIAEQRGLVSEAAYMMAVHGSLGAERNYLNKWQAALEVHLEEHKATNTPLPRLKSVISQINYRAVFKQADVPLPRRHAKGALAKLHDLIDSIAEQVGVGSKGSSKKQIPFVKNGPCSVITYHEAYDFGLRRLANRDAGSIIETGDASAPAASTARRFLGTLKKFRIATGKTNSDIVGPEFGRDFEAVCEQITSSLRSGSTTRQFLLNAQRWQRILAPYISDESEGFGEVVKDLYRRSPFKTITQLAEAANISRRMLSGWMAGRSQPYSPCDPSVAALEKALGVVKGTIAARLSARFGSKKLRGSMLPPSLRRSWDRYSRWIIPLLPREFPELSPEKKEEIGAALMADMETRIPYRMAQRRPSSEKRWRMAEFPAPLAKQIEQFFSYKMRLKPPEGMERNERWRSNGSQSRWHSQFLTVFSLLALPREQGGLAIPNENLTMALLAFEPIMDWVMEALQARSDGILHTGIRYFLGELCSMLNGRFGYIGQRMDLTSNLAPIQSPDFEVTAERIASVTKSAGLWREHCASTATRHAAALEELENDFVFRRRPFDPIEPILALERPRDALVEAAESIYRSLPIPTQFNRSERATALRDFLMWNVFQETVLRRKNVEEMKIVVDRDGRYLPNQGSLQKRENLYYVVVAISDFKNSDSAVFDVVGQRRSGGHDIPPWVMPLPEHLTPFWDEYLASDERGARRNLLERRKTKQAAITGAGPQPLWVTRNGSSVGGENIGQIIYRLSWVHLAHHPFINIGIPGVEPFGPHSFRHITATHVLKVSKNIQLAALAIHDSVDTVRRSYQRWLPAEQASFVRTFLDEDKPTRSWSLAA
ncbi:helix-turn-helix transcriptional regulator [Roseomonas sp. KE2513]|uniref:helix-turn-helix domain-containing protein n=1 Tax=Roseomonas sp. KE2513 TaxID=2479202 RepID=UPI0018DFF324|nr:helix-turn-helix transcriptional regulator [Roseomonas sp. KE2513]